MVDVEHLGRLKRPPAEGVEGAGTRGINEFIFDSLYELMVRSNQRKGDSLRETSLFPSK